MPKSRIKETPVNCRWCGEEGYQSEWRFTHYGACGFCSKSCQDLALEQHDVGNLDWWRTYHPKHNSSEETKNGDDE